MKILGPFVYFFFFFRTFAKNKQYKWISLLYLTFCDQNYPHDALTHYNTGTHNARINFGFG